MLDWLACTLVRFISALLCRVRPSAAVWVGRQVGSLACWLQPRRARVGVLNLRAAFDGTLSPAKARRIIRACYQHLGVGLIELLRLPAIDRAYVDRYITIEGQPHFDEAVASGKPVILLAGHYGNWELSSIVAALLGYPIVALARAQAKFPRLYRLLVSYRQSKGCRIIHKGGAMKRLLAALDARQLVGIVGDQASRQGIFVDFFGRPALFATGPFEMAYRKGATILPAFIHRVRGPFHRVIVEPPIALDRGMPKAAAVRTGIEQFAQMLARHIQEDPTQWLWMHKRWKHTPARRVLVLSDGKSGHVKQSLAVVDALREHRRLLSPHVVEIRYRRGAARALALVWSWLSPSRMGAARCLQWTLSRQSAEALLSRYADCIISCGASTVPANLLWAAEHRAKSVVIMNPAPFPLRRFHLVIAPRHDALPARPNVVQTIGAVTPPWPDETLRQAQERLRAHPRFRPDRSVVSVRRAARPQPPAPGHQPVIAVFVGGDTLHYELSPAFAESLIVQVKMACDAVDGWCLLTTSRRTAPSVERLLAEQLARYPRCRLLLIATRDPIDGTMEGLLGWADVAVVTGESISMVSEACASGRRVVIVEPPLRQSHRPTLTKHRRFLTHLMNEGYARMVPVPELGHTIQRTLHERRPIKCLNDFSVVRDAVARLL